MKRVCCVVRVVGDDVCVADVMRLACAAPTYLSIIPDVPNSKQPGKLLVRFTDGHADVPSPVLDHCTRPTGRNPVSCTAEYAYPIMTAALVPLGTLIVLARNVDEFKAKYDFDVVEQLNALGFNKEFFNKPILTVQGGNCSYLPIPSSTHEKRSI